MINIGLFEIKVLAEGRKGELCPKVNDSIIGTKAYPRLMHDMGLVFKRQNFKLMFLSNCNI